MAALSETAAISPCPSSTLARREAVHQLGTVLTDDEMRQLYDEFAESRNKG